MNFNQKAAVIDYRRSMRGSLGACVLMTLASAASGCGDLEDAPADVTERPAPLDFVNIAGSTSPFQNDSGTVCKPLGTPVANTHCCPDGMVMAGAHFGRNVFRCAKTGASTFSSTSFNQSIRRNGMLSCPAGEVMVGYTPKVTTCGGWPVRVCTTYSDGVFCVRPPGNLLMIEYVSNGQDPADLEGDMHVCRKDTVNPGRFAMSGVDVSTNKFNCLQ